MCDCSATTLKMVAEAIDGLLEDHADDMTAREATFLASLGLALANHAGR